MDGTAAYFQKLGGGDPIESPTQAEQIKAAAGIVLAIADAIKELGQVPSGHLYAHLMGLLSIGAYEQAVQILVDAKVVQRDASHVLTWVGPK